MISSKKFLIQAKALSLITGNANIILLAQDCFANLAAATAVNHVFTQSSTITTCFHVKS